MKTIVLTSTFLRHRYLINEVAAKTDLLGVWQEEKSFEPEQYAGNDDDLKVIREHFAERDASEEQYFADASSLKLGKAKHRVLKSKGINDSAEIRAMAELKPDVALVFGTGILGKEFIEAFDGRIINIHLGLSPYYRGSGTNFWPLVNREPEYVGATIHYLDAGIDTGPIIAHVRPEMKTMDGPHDLGNRTIIAAVKGLLQAAETHVRGTVRGTPQTGDGRLYQRKDFNADAIRRLRKNFETGMIAEYLADKNARDARIRLAQLP